MARNKIQIAEKYNASFPTALRNLMEERGETQENIAKAAEKTRQTVSQYVNGISEPGYETLVKIANYFNVSVDYLLGRTKDPSCNPSAADELGLSSDAVSWMLALANSPDKERYTRYLSVLLEMQSFQTLLFSLIEYFSAVKAASVTESILVNFSSPNDLYPSAKSLNEKFAAAQSDAQYDETVRQFLRTILGFNDAFMNPDMCYVLDDECDGISVLDILELKIKRNLDSVIRGIENNRK